MENMVTVFLFGKKYEVPESLTIMEAMEYSGYQLVRGCGCRPQYDHQPFNKHYHSACRSTGQRKHAGK